jgi:hypothetical protein
MIRELLTVEKENAFICIGLDMSTFAFACFKSCMSSSEYKLLRRLEPDPYSIQYELDPVQVAFRRSRTAELNTGVILWRKHVQIWLHQGRSW